MYHQQQNNWYPKKVYLPISKFHWILAVANLLAHNNLIMLLWASKFESGFLSGKSYEKRTTLSLDDVQTSRKSHR